MPNLTPDPQSEPLSTYNPWQAKPWWCQPWSIGLTGITLMGGSWMLFHQWWFTGLVALPVGVWMTYFLILWPSLMRRYQAEPIEQLERSP
jgi:hypothetical protein